MKTVVSAGDWAVASGDAELVVRGLGSCVAVILYDPIEGVGGLAHILLPDPQFASSGPRKKFASTAIPDLLRILERRGAQPERLLARLVGGASMFPDLLSSGQVHMGERNVAAARAALASASVEIVGEDTGGDYGRSVFFALSDGTVRVTAARRADVLV